MPTKFAETVNIQPQDTQTGAASGLLSIADRLEAFETLGKQTIAFAGEKRQQQLAADDAHNKALRDAYISGVDNDIRTEVERIKNENSDDVISFNEAVKGYSKGMIESVDPAIRLEAATIMDDRITNARIQVQSKQHDRQRTEAKAELQTALNEASFAAAKRGSEGDKLGASEELARVVGISQNMMDAGFMTQDDRAILLRESEREATEQLRRAELDSLPIEEATETINMWDKEVPKGWEPDEWDTFITSARQDIKYRKTEQEAEKVRLAELDKEVIFNQIADGKDASFAIKTSENLSASSKKEWTSYAQSQTDRAKTAKRAEITQNRADIRWEQEQYNKAETIATQTQQEMLMGFYNKGVLTTDLVNASDAPETLKKSLNEMVKQQEATALKVAEEQKTRLAETYIQSRMGEWSYQELLDYGISQDMDPKSIEYWWDQNKTTQDNPDDFKNGFVYKLGVAQLAKDKTNGLFIGEKPKNQVQINENNQLYMNIAKEYEKRSAVEGADPAEILNELQQPFVQESAKNWIMKLLTDDLRQEAFPELFEETPDVQTDYTVLSDEELEELL